MNRFIASFMMAPSEEWEKVYSSDRPKTITAKAANGQTLKTKWKQEKDRWELWVYYNGIEKTPVTLEETNSPKE